MPETLTERIAAVTGLAAAVVLVFLALSARTNRTTTPVAASVAPATATAPVVTETEQPLPATSRPVAARPRPARTADLILTAARGDCWVSVRTGSADGKVLYEGILASGKSVQAKAPRLWLRLGAAANVDVTVNGKRAAALPAGTVDVVATPAGVAPAV